MLDGLFHQLLLLLALSQLFLKGKNLRLCVYAWGPLCRRSRQVVLVYRWVRRYLFHSYLNSLHYHHVFLSWSVCGLGCDSLKLLHCHCVEHELVVSLFQFHQVLLERIKASFFLHLLKLQRFYKSLQILLQIWKHWGVKLNFPQALLWGQVKICIEGSVWIITRSWLLALFSLCRSNFWWSIGNRPIFWLTCTSYQLHIHILVFANSLLKDFASS